MNQLLSQAPAGFLPRVYYGLTRGNDTYRFADGASLTQEVTGSVGTAFQLYSENETDNNYIPAVAVKQDENTIKIVIRGDYNVNTSSFNAVNMTTGASATVTFTNPLTLQPASSLSDYPAEDNKEKQITVIYDLETNSKNVIFASLDYNSDGVYNWVEIGNFVDGIDGLSVRSINSSNYSSVKALCRVNDTLLAGEAFTADGTSFVIGGLYNVDTLSPFALTLVGNIRGATGATGATGAAGADGEDGATPYIQDNYWYIDGTNTNVKAIGTDGTDGADGTSFQMQSGLYSVPANWGQSGNIDPDGNTLLQLPTLPTTGITGKGYVVYDPLTTPLAPYYDLYYANDGDVSWTIIHPFNGVAGQNGTDGYTPYIQNNNWYINGVNTGVPATGPQGPQGPTGQGVPAGGTAGQVLSKIDGTDYNTEWVTPSAGGGVQTDSTTSTVVGLLTLLNSLVANGKTILSLKFSVHTVINAPNTLRTVTTTNLATPSFTYSSGNETIINANTTVILYPAKYTDTNDGTFSFVSHAGTGTMTIMFYATNTALARMFKATINSSELILSTVSGENITTQLDQRISGNYTVTYI